MIDPLTILAALAVCFVAMGVIRATRNRGGGW